MKAKKIMTFLLAMLMCFSSLLHFDTLKASAAGEKAEVYMAFFPRDGDANYNKNWGHGSLNFMNGWKASKSTMPERPLSNFMTLS